MGLTSDERVLSDDKPKKDNDVKSKDKPKEVKK